MSIDNIHLPVSFYPSIFKKHLVDIQKKSGGKEKAKADGEIEFLGGNEKNITFIVRNKENKFLNDNELKFLSGLITACEITMGDISIVNLSHNKDVNYNVLTSHLRSQKILCFDVSATDIDLPFNIPYFQVQAFQEIQYIFCPGLEQLQNDVDSKKQLWASLQKIFKIRK